MMRIPSSAGTSHVGPTVRRLGRPICRPIATTSVTCTGQNDSGPGGGG